MKVFAKREEIKEFNIRFDAQKNNTVSNSDFMHKHLAGMWHVLMILFE